MSPLVEVIGICSLVLSSGFIFHLEKIFFVPSFFKNLISFKNLHLSVLKLYFRILFLVCQINLKILVLINCVMIFIPLFCKIIILCTLCLG